MEESYSTLLHMLGHTLSPFQYIKFASLTLHLLWKNSPYFIVSTLMIYGHYFFISECLFKLLKFQYFSHTDTLYFLHFLIFFFFQGSQYRTGTSHIGEILYWPLNQCWYSFKMYWKKYWVVPAYFNCTGLY